MEANSDWIVELLRIVAAIISGAFGCSIKNSVSCWFSGNKVTTRDTNVKQHSESGGVAFMAGTMNFGIQSRDVDYVVAEDSSENIKSRTINRLELKRKTILRLPSIERGRCSDAMLRIDTGDTVYPIGVSLTSDVFDAFDQSWLSLNPNSRNYLMFTYVGDDLTGRHVWMVARSAAVSYGGDRIINSVPIRKTRYGKLDASGQIKYAEDLLLEKDVLWGNPTEDMMIQNGYRTIEANASIPCREGFYLERIGWKDDGHRLIAQYKEVPVPVPSSGT